MHLPGSCSKALSYHKTTPLWEWGEDTAQESHAQHCLVGAAMQGDRDVEQALTEPWPRPARGSTPPGRARSILNKACVLITFILQMCEPRL